MPADPLFARRSLFKGLQGGRSGIEPAVPAVVGNYRPLARTAGLPRLTGTDETTRTSYDVFGARRQLILGLFFLCFALSARFLASRGLGAGGFYTR